MYPDKKRAGMKALAQRRVQQSPYLVQARNIYAQLYKEAV